MSLRSFSALCSAWTIWPIFSSSVMRASNGRTFASCVLRLAAFAGSMVAAIVKADALTNSRLLIFIRIDQLLHDLLRCIWLSQLARIALHHGEPIRIRQ